MNRKVTVFGAGFVGSTTAQRFAEKQIGDVVLHDIIEGMPQGKALDMMQSACLEGFDATSTAPTIPPTTPVAICRHHQRPRPQTRHEPRRSC